MRCVIASVDEVCDAFSGSFVALFAWNFVHVPFLICLNFLSNRHLNIHVAARC